MASFKKFKKILGLNDSPHTISLGVGIGVFVAFTFTIPFHMIITLTLAWIFRANKTAAVIAVWISNPLTDPVIFFMGYYIGCILLRYPLIDQEILWSYWDELTELELLKPVDLFHQMIDFIKKVWFTIGPPLYVGGLLCSLVFGLASYFIFLRIIKKRRDNKRKKLLLMKSDSSSQLI